MVSMHMCPMCQHMMKLDRTVESRTKAHIGNVMPSSPTPRPLGMPLVIIANQGIPWYLRSANRIASLAGLPNKAKRLFDGTR